MKANGIYSQFSLAKPDGANTPPQQDIPALIEKLAELHRKGSDGRVPKQKGGAAQALMTLPTEGSRFSTCRRRVGSIRFFLSCIGSLLLFIFFVFYCLIRFFERGVL